MSRKSIHLPNIISLLFISALSFTLFILPIKLGTPYIDEIGFFVPSLIDLFFGTWPSIALCAMAILLFFIILTDYLVNNKSVLYFSFNSILICLFLIICSYSLLWSVNFHASKINLILILSASTGFIASKKLTNPKTPEIFISYVYIVILSSAVFVAVNGIYQYMYGLDEMRQFIDIDALKKTAVLYKNTDTQRYSLYLRLISNRIFSTFVYPNSLAGYLCMIIPFAFELFRFKKDRRKFIYVRTAAISGIILVFWFFMQYYTHFIPIAILGVIFFPITIFAALLLTLSKGGFLTITIFIIIYAVVLMKNRLKFSKKKIIPVIFIIIFLMCFLAKSMLHLNLNSFNARIKYWQAVKSMVVEKPLTGFGIGSFGSVYPKYRIIDSEETQFAHNIYLQKAAELGVFGALFFILFLFTPLFKFFFKNDNRNDVFYCACGFSLLTFSIHGLVDFDFSIPVLAFYAFFMIGYLGKYDKQSLLKIPFLKYVVVLVMLTLFLVFKTVTNYLGSQAYFNASHYEINEQKNTEKALKYLREAQKLNQDNSAVDFLMGSIYLSDKSYKKAIEAFTQAVEKNPYRAAYHYHLALALAKSGLEKNKEKALFEFSEALSYNPLRIEYKKAYEQYKKGIIVYENTGS